MRRLALLALVVTLAACSHDHTAPKPALVVLPASCTSTPVTTKGGGCWSWSGDLGLPVTAIGASFTFNADGSSQARWVGRPASCDTISCFDSGFGTPQTFGTDSLVVQLSANNSNYSLTIGGRVSGETLTGTVSLFQSGKASAAKAITLTRAR